MTALSFLTQTADAVNQIWVSCQDGTDIYDEIQAAVDTLRDLGGGVIILPAGAFQFSGIVGGPSVSYLMPGNIEVIGQGIGTTILRKSVTSSAFFDVNHWSFAGGWLRISGISFYGVPPEIGMTSSGIQVSNIVDFRIDHCFFSRINYNIGVRSAAGYPQSRGVVDHCTFDAADLGSAYGVFDTREWLPDMQLGTANATFIEDCLFDGFGHAAAAFDGGHYVLRYSTILDSGSIDAHGPGFGCCFRGTRASEIYENLIYHDATALDNRGWTAIGLRAGGGVIFNNTFEHFDVHVRFTIESQSYQATSGVYPTLDQVHDMFVWGNTLIDITGDPSAIPCSDPSSNPDRCHVDGILLYSNSSGTLIQKDRDFYLRPPSAALDPNVGDYSPYQYPHPLTQIIFRDGFETGDTTAWTGG